jgi:excisionase family DNA binding protein
MAFHAQPPQLREALDRLREALEFSESALLEFENTLDEGGAPEHERRRRRGSDLLSIPDVCQELDMGKSWVYQRLKSGEIPSIRLGRVIKVRRADLEEYLNAHRYTAADETPPL